MIDENWLNEFLGQIDEFKKIHTTGAKMSGKKPVIICFPIPEQILVRYCYGVFQ